MNNNEPLSLAARAVRVAAKQCEFAHDGLGLKDQYEANKHYAEQVELLLQAVEAR